MNPSGLLASGLPPVLTEGGAGLLHSCPVLLAGLALLRQEGRIVALIHPVVGQTQAVIGQHLLQRRHGRLDGGARGSVRGRDVQRRILGIQRHPDPDGSQLGRRQPDLGAVLSLHDHTGHLAGELFLELGTVDRTVDAAGKQRAAVRANRRMGARRGHCHAQAERTTFCSSRRHCRRRQRRGTCVRGGRTRRRRSIGCRAGLGQGRRSARASCGRHASILCGLSRTGRCCLCTPRWSHGHGGVHCGRSSAA